MVNKMITCPVCGGDGVASDWEWNAGEPCESCEGNGTIPLPESPIDYIELHIDEGGEGSWHDCANSIMRVIARTKKLYEGNE